MKQSVRYWREKYRESLAGVHPQEEVDALFNLVLESELEWSKADFLLRQDFTPTDDQCSALRHVLSLLQAGKPLQYILQRAHFYDMELYVDEHVLIPRPETEELVHLILDDLASDTLASILDIGTGSGCIPIALKKNRLLTRVYAGDISLEALSVAKRNAAQQQVEVDFFSMDVLQTVKQAWPWSPSKLDVIVSNPPYVPKAEKTEMARHVLDHEPHLALFVDDADSLVFYRQIAHFAKSELKTGGRLYFEIHADKGSEMLALLTACGFEKLELFKDLSGRDRMIRCVNGHQQ